MTPEERKELERLITEYSGIRCNIGRVLATKKTLHLASLQNESVASRQSIIAFVERLTERKEKE